MIIEITETHVVWYPDEDGPETLSCESFIIDTDKIAAVLADNEHALHYTKFIIAAAQAGVQDHEASVKYSFTDTTDEYELIRADEGAAVEARMSVALEY